MNVVNVKVAHIRPQYQNLKEWCEDSNNAYIGRRGIVFIDGVRYPLKDSPFANPYKITKNLDRNDVIKMYRNYIVEKIISGEVDIKHLSGKNLGCWCKPESCHGDVLIELLEIDDFSQYSKDHENKVIIISNKDEVKSSNTSTTISQQKVKNPETKRMIIIGKGVYNNLIKKGYRLIDNELVL